MGLRLYTQPRCGWCDMMKNMLEEIGQQYSLIDISQDPAGLAYMKTKGHTTVPQLYWNGSWVNDNISTADLDSSSLSKRIERSQNSERSAGFNGA